MKVELQKVASKIRLDGKLHDEIVELQAEIIEQYLIKVSKIIEENLIRLGYDTSNIEQLSKNEFNKVVDSKTLNESYYINGQLIVTIESIFKQPNI